MRKRRPHRRWEVSVLDERKEHIELRHGDAGENPYNNWLSIGRIGKPNHHCFPVQFLIKPEAVENQALIADARRELGYYLVEKNEPDPWAYAQHHCNTGANIYSRVHWSYFPDGQGGKRVSSRVIQLSAEEREKPFGESKARENTKDDGPT